MNCKSDGTARIVKAVVNLPQLPDDRLYDYLIPPEWDEVPAPGMRILAPFGGQRAEAIVWAHASTSAAPAALKEVHETLDEEPIFNDLQRHLIDWMARTFFCRRLDLLHLFLPPGLKVATEKCWRAEVGRAEIEEYLAGLSLSPDLYRRLQAKVQAVTAEFTKIPQVDQAEQQVLAKLVRDKLVSTRWLPKKPEITAKKVMAYTLRDPSLTVSDLKLTLKQARVYTYLAAAAKEVAATELLSATGVSAGVPETLCKKGLLLKTFLTVERNPLLQHGHCGRQDSHQLNTEQEEALQAITVALRKNEAHTFLLHGVTGSGKTEVYLQAIEETLRKGREAIYLVPEISLTPQTVQRVRARFGDEVAILHSSLSAGERFDQWWRIKRGEVKVVVGARSALFAPVPDLGLIIMDEEHEYTYKQEETPRYHARTVAKELARLTGSPLILGSATPSLESYWEAESGEITRLVLSKRIMDRPLPEIRLVDLRAEFKARRFTVLSPPLRAAIEETLSRGEQVILLLNRRGYATFINCRECGQVLKCPSCDVTLTYHQRPNVLRCHYCGYKEKPPDTCPHCRSHYIRYFGKGTQRLEEELQSLFPLARMVRMDLDTTGRKGSHERIYRQLVEGEVDILIGTQMVAKGLDLPGVTLVGVVAADSALGLPDFRSAERTYQILTQAAGRAGRGEKPGLVYIQTFNPGHYSISAVVNQNEAEFYRKELMYRQAGDFPPFTNLIRLVFSGPEKEAVIRAAAEVTAEIKKAFATVETSTGEEGEKVIGPTPAAIERVQNRYRWQTLIKTQDISNFYGLLPETVSAVRRQKYNNVRIIIDENPFSML